MCYVYEWELIHASGARSSQHRIRPCPAGTVTSPCPDFELIREPPRRVGSVGAIDIDPDPVMPEYVESRPSPARGDTSLRARRGANANPLRLEWSFHVPFTSRSTSSSRRQSGSGLPGFGPVATTSATYTSQQRRQFVNYRRSEFAGTWQTWTPPPPRIITIDPARHTPPETPSTGRRSRSVEPVAGREHTRRSHSRHHSSSSRPSGHRISPPLRRRESSPASVDGERYRHIQRINARYEALERELARARARNAATRIYELEREIESLRRQRRPRPRTVEVHQGEQSAVRLPHRPRHQRASESLEERGRRLLQRDVDAGAARYGVSSGGRGPTSGGRGASATRRYLTNGDRERERDGIWEAFFRRGSLRRPGREHIVFEGEPRGGARHR